MYSHSEMSVMRIVFDRCCLNNYLTLCESEKLFLLNSVFYVELK